jgi:hypothetical protein
MSREEDKKETWQSLKRAYPKDRPIYQWWVEVPASAYPKIGLCAEEEITQILSAEIVKSRK